MDYWKVSLLIFGCFDLLYSNSCSETLKTRSLIHRAQSFKVEPVTDRYESPFKIHVQSYLSFETSLFKGHLHSGDTNFGPEITCIVGGTVVCGVISWQQRRHANWVAMPRGIFACDFTSSQSSCGSAAKNYNTHPLIPPAMRASTEKMFT